MQEGKILKKRYCLEKKMNSGGMADIFLAIDQANKNRCVIKVLSQGSSEEKKRFFREYEFLRSVKHLCLIQTIDFFEEKEDLFIVQEFIAGKSLGEILREQTKTFPLSEKLVIANNIARGVEVLNRAGILHRDIKPDNIMIHKEAGIVKLIDLGIGKDLAKAQEKLTLNQEIIGTLPYMSPEQAEGKYSEQSDVFSLGVTLYQFFLEDLHSPFQDSNTLSVIYKVAHYRPPTIWERVQETYSLSSSEKEGYERISLLIALSMEKFPNQRCSSAQFIADNLAQIHKEVFSSSRQLKKDTTLELSPEVSKELRQQLLEIKNKEENLLSSQVRKKTRSRRLPPKKTSSTRWWIIGVSLLVVSLPLFFSKPFIPQKKNIVTLDKGEKYFQKSLHYWSLSQFPLAWNALKKANNFSSKEIYQGQKALFLYHGYGVKKNPAEATKIVQRILPKLETKKEIHSLYLLGSFYFLGIGVEENHDQAHFYLSQAAHQKYLLGINLLALLYETSPQKKNFSLAFSWFNEAAEQQDPLALTNIARLYHFGRGVKKDEQKALEFALKSAQMGQTGGMCNLALLYSLRDPLTENDKSQTLFWYEKAASFGTTSAIHSLAKSYEQGLFTPRDYSKAISWYEKAIEKNDSKAMTSLAYLYSQGLGVRRSYEKAFRLYEKAAQEGNANAMYSLAFMHIKGFVNRSPDYQEAFLWYKKAAENNHAKACARLGYLYELGRGTSSNLEKAVYWYDRAFELGAEEEIRRIKGK